eukprot:gene2547-2784_t
MKKSSELYPYVIWSFELPPQNQRTQSHQRAVMVNCLKEEMVEVSAEKASHLEQTASSKEPKSNRQVKTKMSPNCSNEVLEE